ncbi:hypothetical protein GCM10020254_80970 [Streptomyces goshikiensis]
MPAAIRMFRAEAASNNASTDSGYTAQNVKAVVVPLRSNSPQNDDATCRAYPGSENRCSSTKV